MAESKKFVPEMIDGRPVGRENKHDGFSVFEPMRDPKDPSAGVSSFPHLTVHDDGRMHMTDLVLSANQTFGEGNIRMEQFSSHQSSAVDKRVRISTTTNTHMHRTQDRNLGEEGAVSPRTQVNTKPRHDFK